MMKRLSVLLALISMTLQSLNPAFAMFQEEIDSLGENKSQKLQRISGIEIQEEIRNQASSSVNKEEKDSDLEELLNHLFVTRHNTEGENQIKRLEWNKEVIKNNLDLDEWEDLDLKNVLGYLEAALSSTDPAYEERKPNKKKDSPPSYKNAHDSTMNSEEKDSEDLHGMDPFSESFDFRKKALRDRLYGTNAPHRPGYDRKAGPTALEERVLPVNILDDIPINQVMHGGEKKQSGAPNQNNFGEQSHRSPDNPQGSRRNNSSRGQEESLNEQRSRDFIRILRESELVAKPKELIGNIYDVLFLQGDEFLRRLYLENGTNANDLPLEDDIDLISRSLEFLDKYYEQLKEYKKNSHWERKKDIDPLEPFYDKNDKVFKNLLFLKAVENSECKDLRNFLEENIPTLKTDEEQEFTKGYAQLIQKNIRLFTKPARDILETFRKYLIEEGILSEKDTEKFIDSFINLTGKYQKLNKSQLKNDLEYFSKMKDNFLGKKRSNIQKELDINAKRANVVIGEINFILTLKTTDGKRIKRTIPIPLHLKEKDLLTCSNATSASRLRLDNLRGQLNKNVDRINKSSPQGSFYSLDRSIKENIEDPTTSKHSEKSLYVNLNDPSAYQGIATKLFSALEMEIFSFWRLYQLNKTYKEGQNAKNFSPISEVTLQDIFLNLYSTRGPCGDCELILGGGWEEIYDKLSTAFEEMFSNAKEGIFLKEFGFPIGFRLLEKKRHRLNELEKNMIFTQVHKYNDDHRPLKETWSRLNIDERPKQWLEERFLWRRYEANTPRVNHLYILGTQTFFLNEPTFKLRLTLENDKALAKATQDYTELNKLGKKYSNNDLSRTETQKNLLQLINKEEQDLDLYQNKFLPSLNKIAQALNEENTNRRNLAARKIQLTQREIKSGVKKKTRHDLLKTQIKDFMAQEKLRAPKDSESVDINLTTKLATLICTKKLAALLMDKFKSDDKSLSNVAEKLIDIVGQKLLSIINVANPFKHIQHREKEEAQWLSSQKEHLKESEHKKDIHKENISEWYAHDTISGLLQRYLPEIKDNIYSHIESADRLNEALEDYARSKRVTPAVFVLNIHAEKKDFSSNNHWVGIIIKTVEEGISEKEYKVFYFDPMGSPVNSDLKNFILNHDKLKAQGDITLEEPFKDYSLQVGKFKSAQEVSWWSGNQNDCGPLLVYLLTAYLKDRFPEALDSLAQKSLGLEQSLELGTRFRIINSMQGTFEELMIAFHETLKPKLQGTTLNSDMVYPHKDFVSYYKNSIEEIINFRFTQEKKTTTLYPLYFNVNQDNVVQFSKKTSHQLNQSKSIIAPINLYDRHWTGLVAEKEGNNWLLTYMDPENQPIPSALEAKLQQNFAELTPGQEVTIRQRQVETQKHGNCGPEVVENFIEYLIGQRVSQEAAVLLHSRLMEDHLLNRSTPASVLATEFPSKPSHEEEFVVLTPEGQVFSPQNEAEIKLRDQLVYAHNGGMLFDSAKTGLAQGYKVQKLASRNNNAHDTVMASPNRLRAPFFDILDEKLENQARHYVRTGVAFDTLRRAANIQPAENANRRRTSSLPALGKSFRASL